MKIAVFSAKPYDREFLDAANAVEGHQLKYFDDPLNWKPSNLPRAMTPSASSSTTPPTQRFSTHSSAAEPVSSRCAAPDSITWI